MDRYRLLAMVLALSFPVATSAAQAESIVQPLGNPQQANVTMVTQATRSHPHSSAAVRHDIGRILPSAHGLTFAIPFSVSRVELPAEAKGANNYQRTGRIIASFQASQQQCTAALIKPGIVVTGAHCVAKWKGGVGGVAKTVSFAPGADKPWNDAQPLGKWTARAVVVPNEYAFGTDYCADPINQVENKNGVNCINDLALVVLENKSGKNLGDSIGYYKYDSSPYGFIGYYYQDDKLNAQVTILGYTSFLESGAKLIRNDTAVSVQKSAQNKLYKAGGVASYGSSGSPWFVNFGPAPAVASGKTIGYQTTQKIIGVTVGYFHNIGNYVDYQNIRQIYGAPFAKNKFYPISYGQYGSGNIGFLMMKACANFPDAC